MKKLSIIIIILALIAIRFIGYHPINAELNFECDTIIKSNDIEQIEKVADSLFFTGLNTSNLDTITELPYKQECRIQ